MKCAVAVQALLRGAADDWVVVAEAGKWSHQYVNVSRKKYQR